MTCVYDPSVIGRAAVSGPSRIPSKGVEIMRRTLWVLLLVAGCSDPINIYLVDEGETETQEGTSDTSDVPTDETVDTSPETSGTVSETSGSDTWSGTGSATVDTGSGSGTVDTSSGTVDTESATYCPFTCNGKAVCESNGGTVHPEYNGGCKALWCCEPGEASTATVDTSTGSGTVDTGSENPCAGLCFPGSDCFSWINSDGDCPSGKTCCVKSDPVDTGTGSASDTVDTDTSAPCKYDCKLNCDGPYLKMPGICSSPVGSLTCCQLNPKAETCPWGDDPKYICEWRGFCVGTWKEDVNFVCDDPGNKACCRKQY